MQTKEDLLHKTVLTESEYDRLLELLHSKPKPNASLAKAALDYRRRINQGQVKSASGRPPV